MKRIRARKAGKQTINKLTAAFQRQARLDKGMAINEM